MRIPQKPPVKRDICEMLKSEERSLWIEILTRRTEPTVDGKYIHWDKLRYYTTPKRLNHEQWWYCIKSAREKLYKMLPFYDKDGHGFKFAITDYIQEHLHKTDKGSAGEILSSNQEINSSDRDRYCISSLIQEAITSSQLEGAATTRKVAKDMLRSGRAPKDKHEQMILNNFKTMKRIQELKNEPLTPEIVFKIHRIVTDGTLDDPDNAGCFRSDSDNVRIEDQYNTVLHDPPSAESLPRRLDLLCEFANGGGCDYFIHPVIRAIIIHFWLAYDHPFVDGNGRTARALFYWAMLKQGYWLFEYISISQILLNAPVKYARAFLYTETDDNDLTYFIIYHLDVIDKAVSQLHDYIDRKSAELERLGGQLEQMQYLNHRQQALLSHALRHPYHRYTVRSHKTSHGIVYETARRDLWDLENREFLTAFKVGKAWNFKPVDNLGNKLSATDGHSNTTNY